MTGAISSATSNNYVASTQAEAIEPPGRDTKNDHDKDDGGAAAATSSVKPTVNTQGQALGTVLNAKA